MRFKPFVFFILLILLTSVVHAAEMDELKEHYDKGLRHYQLGNYSEAATEFETFLSKEPSSEQVLNLLETSSTRPFVDMRQIKVLRDVSHRIMELPIKSNRQLRLDDDRTKGLIEDIRVSRYSNAGDINTLAIDAKEKLAVVGAPAVPFMIEHLGAKNSDKLRGLMMVTINSIGNEAVLPLIQALNHSNEFVRANSAALLGHSRDKRALAALKALHENESNEMVRLECERALLSISGQSVDVLPEARLLYLKQATDYEHARAHILRDTDFRDNLYIFWSWDPESASVTRTLVPPYIWHLEMAEEACYRALQTKGKTPDEEIYPVLSNIYFSQIDKIDALIKAAKLNDRPVDDLVAHRKELRRAAMFGPLFGSDTLHESLRLAIVDGNSSLTERINKALVDINGNIQHSSAKSAILVAGENEE